MFQALAPHSHGSSCPSIFPFPELEKQMKIENLFVTWQQRSAQSNMPISVSASWGGGRLKGLDGLWGQQQAVSGGGGQQ